MFAWVAQIDCSQENINMEMILIKQEEVKYEMECFNLELIRLGQSF